MTATPRRAPKSLDKIWPVPVVLLPCALFLVTLWFRGAIAGGDVDTPPTSEETARYLEWYKKQRSQNAPLANPAPPGDDQVKFRESYNHTGVPQPIPLPPDDAPSAEEIARYLESQRARNNAATQKPVPPTDDLVRYRESMNRTSVPQAIPLPPDDAPAPDAINRYLESQRAQKSTTVAPQELPRPLPDLPSPERVRRYLESERAQNTTTPTNPAPPVDNAASFRESYNHTSAPRPHAEVIQSETVARFVDWFNHEKPTLPPGKPYPPPTREDVVRFLAWYKHNGKPAPGGPLLGEAPPTNEQVAQFVEAYHRSCAPAPHPSPYATPLDVQPIYDPKVQTVASQEPAPPPIQVAAPPPVFVEMQPRPIPVPPPPPRSLEAPKETKPVAVDPPAPLPPIPVQSPAPSPDKPPVQAAEKPSDVAPTAEKPPVEAPVDAFQAPFDALLQQMGCSSCGNGGGLLGLHAQPDGGGGPSTAGPGCNCGSGNCVPGRLHHCSTCEADTVVGRFLCGIYECICCPDPCYDPKWIPIADSAFFVDSARPQTQQRVGWDMGRNLILPDRGEYFWARADGKGQGPNPGNHANPGGLLGEKSVNYHELYMYTEAALGNIGTFIYMPYRSLDGDLVGHAAGFSDMQLGTKTLLFDCELLQIALEFRTYLPVGNAAKGLGTGHVSLEPGLVIGLKIAQDTYFQGEMSEWIPIGGDTDYEGAMLRYSMSFNQVLCRILPDVPLVGTLEFEGLSFQHGLYTDPFAGPGQRATGGTYISMGPGLRLFVCDKIDFGIGTSFAVTDHHFADELFRSEFRWRF